MLNGHNRFPSPVVQKHNIMSKTENLTGSELPKSPSTPPTHVELFKIPNITYTQILPKLHSTMP